MLAPTAIAVRYALENALEDAKDAVLRVSLYRLRSTGTATCCIVRVVRSGE